MTATTEIPEKHIVHWITHAKAHLLFCSRPLLLCLGYSMGHLAPAARGQAADPAITTSSKYAVRSIAMAASEPRLYGAVWLPCLMGAWHCWSGQQQISGSSSVAVRLLC